MGGQRIPSEYLGQVEGLHLYAQPGRKAEALWPTALADIIQTLKPNP